MKKTIIAAFSLLFIGCVKEESTLYYAYIKNGTSHKVQIKPYFSGSIPSDKIITLLANESKEIANGFDRGKGDQGFSSSYFGGPGDSIIVVFDDLYSITHYSSTPASVNPRHYLFTSLRNIGNPKSYDLQSRDISKYQRENKYTYTFIEQDYLDAR
jgi:hypothetical protein